MMHGFNFTERVRKVLATAREEAARLHHEYVGTEHILLGLTRDNEGVAVTALQNLNVDLGDVRDRVEGVVKRGRAAGSSGPDLPYTSRAKTVLELAMREARALGHAYVGTEHLLLGLIAEGKGIAAQVLAEAGVQLEPIRGEILRILGTDIPPQVTLPALIYEGPSSPPPRGTIERVEVVVHYDGGGRVRMAFDNVPDAQTFLSWAGGRRME